MIDEQCVPPVSYLPTFLNEDEARPLFDSLLASIPWESKTIQMYGKTVAVPRLTCWFGCTSYKYSGIVNHPQPWNDILIDLRHCIERECGANFNSCLANLYRNGYDSVGWHADDEVELGPRPVIASLSLGAVRTFKLRHVASGHTVDYILPSGSLLIMRDTCQTEWVHALPKRVGSKYEKIMGARINLTFRTFMAANV